MPITPTLLQCAESRKAWATGGALGLPIPADLAALCEGGADWLTRALHAMGSLALDNSVVAITGCEPLVAGGTGTKALLSVGYSQPNERLPAELFVKFSRNFSDPAMDRARFHMGPEIRFAVLSRKPGFPIVVPQCLFADFVAACGTGLLITERIGFGQGAIERQYGKCLDHELPAPLDHYRVLIRTLARLAGSAKGGKPTADIAGEFPFDLAAVLTADRLTYTDQQRRNRVSRYAAFAVQCPQLLPAAIRSEAFITRFDAGFALFCAHQDAIKRFLHAQPDFIALCHWNANSDNAWYWHDASGELQCGLLDWGSVGQMHVAMTLWGCLSSAEQWLWRDHLDELLLLFVAEYAAASGPKLDLAELRTHLLLYVAMMGLCWLLDAPPRIRGQIPDIAETSGRLDARILASETARVQLQMMVNFLMFWEAEDATGVISRLFNQGVEP